MERNINNIKRVIGDRNGEPEIKAAGFFGDLTKKLISSAGEKAASALGSKAGEALGSKAGEALGNKLFKRKKVAKAAPSASPMGAPLKKGLNSPEGALKESLKPLKAAPIVEENKGSELIKLLQVENKISPQSSIHEIYNRLLSQE